VLVLAEVRSLRSVRDARGCHIPLSSEGLDIDEQMGAGPIEVLTITSSA
jgi:hypothetical protein